MEWTKILRTDSVLSELLKKNKWKIYSKSFDSEYFFELLVEVTSKYIGTIKDQMNQISRI